jgi:hypothetical protein
MSDFQGFIGQAYEAPDPYQDSQRLINWYLEISQDDKSKTPTALLGCPGLNPIIQLGVVGAVRGSWVLPGGVAAVYVSGNTVYLVTTTVPPTQNAIAQFATSTIGTLNTNSGQVSIRDNGAGGYVVLADGLNGYYYRIAGAGSTAFIGTPTNGSATLPYSGQLNTALVVGSVLSGTGIAPGATIVSVNTSAGTITMSAVATSSPGAVTITVTLAAFGVISDPGFEPPDRWAFVDGWLLANRHGSQEFCTNSPVPYTLLFDPLFFALKDSSSDNLISLQEINREVWLVGERASEIWFNAGGVNFAWQRIPGAAPPIGTSACQSVAQVGDSLMWLGKTAQGENIVVQTQQYSWKRVSTHAIEKQIASYPLVSDAFGFAYEDQGHLFYILTFPTADKTWCYDASAGMWHERASYDDNLGVFHRFRGNCFANFQNLRLVGDYQSGQIHQMSRSIYDDAGEPLVAVRRCPHIWDRDDRERVFLSRLQIEFAPGVGLQTGQGENPQAILRWSNDGATTFGTEHWASIGKAGRYKNRAMWRRLGEARDRVFEVRVTDPVYRDVVGASLLPPET